MHREFWAGPSVVGSWWSEGCPAPSAMRTSVAAATFAVALAAATATPPGDGGAVRVEATVDGAVVALVASTTQEPFFASNAFCAAHELRLSTEGLGCTSLLAEELIARGGRFVPWRARDPLLRLDPRADLPTLVRRFCADLLGGRDGGGGGGGGGDWDGGGGDSTWTCGDELLSSIRALGLELGPGPELEPELEPELGPELGPGPELEPELEPRPQDGVRDNTGPIYHYLPLDVGRVNVR